VESGTDVPPFYDSLLAKMIAHGPSRDVAIARLLAALEGTQLEGVKSNVSLHQRLLKHPAFVAGDTDTAFIETHLGLKS
jgi:acetyl/propionyl-CoA carboxylase alpha subunit